MVNNKNNNRAFVPDAITIQADMGVRIHKTGENIQPGSIQHGDIGGHVQFMPHGNNAAVFQQQVDLLWFRVNGIMNPAPAHQQRRGGMFCICLLYTSRRPSNARS